jgi:hypothetical protein
MTPVKKPVDPEDIAPNAFRGYHHLRWSLARTLPTKLKRSRIVSQSARQQLLNAGRKAR